MAPTNSVVTRAVAEVRRRAQGTARVVRIAGAAWRWLAAAAMLLLVDAAWPMSAMGRMVADLAAVAGLVWVVWRWRLPVGVRGGSELRWAKFVEGAAGLRRHPLVTAMQLRGVAAVSASTAASAGEGATVTAMLAARAVEEGESAAKVVDARAIVDGRAVKRAGMFLVGASVVILGASAAYPRLPTAVVPRFVDPFGDHPPFTVLDFAITCFPSYENVIAGDDVDVCVVIDGRVSEPVCLAVDRTNRRRVPADADSLIARGGGIDGVGGNFSVLPLTEVPELVETRFEHTLTDLREVVSACVVVKGRARSKWIRIVPRHVPRLTAAEAAVFEPRTEEGDEESTMIVRDLSAGPIVMHEGGRVEMRLFGTIPGGGDDGDVDGATGQVATVSRELKAGESLGVEETEWRAESGCAVLILHAEQAGEERRVLALEDGEGRRSRETVEVTIRVVADQSPSVQWIRPRRNAAALPGARFTAEAAAHDDLGLSSVRFEVTISRAGEPTTMAASEELLKIGTEEGTATWRGARHLVLHPMIHLAAFEAQPGDVVKCTARAVDDRAESRGGPQSAEAVFEILVIDEQMYREIAKARGQNDSAEQMNGDSTGGESSGDQSARGGAGDAANGESATGSGGDANAPAAAGGNSKETSGGSEGQGGEGVGEDGGGDGDGGGGDGGKETAGGESNGMADQARLSAAERDIVGMDDGSTDIASSMAQSEEISTSMVPGNPPEDATHAWTVDNAAPYGLAPSEVTVEGAAGATDAATEGGGAGSTPMGEWSSVPPAYRDLVAKYFARLAKDAARQENRR